MGGLLQLARPLNCVMSAVGVLIGGVVAVGLRAWGSSTWPLVFAALAAASFTASGNALNDIYDRETDKVNHPERPIPSGRMTVREATIFATIAFLAAIVLAVFASLECVGIVAVNGVVMVSYESRLKGRGMSGNLAIAYLVASLFLFGGFAVYGRTSEPILRTGVLGALAFFATVGREITKDIEDMTGDVDRRTLPQRIGAKPAGAVAAVAFFVGVALSIVPSWLAVLRLGYLAIVLLADGIFIYAALYSATNPGRAQQFAKYAMIVALAAFLAGGVLQ